MNLRSRISRINEIRHLGRAVRLVWSAAPRWTLVNLALVVLQGTLPLASLYATRRIVDGIASATSSGGISQHLQTIALWIALAGLIALVSSLARALSEITALAQSTMVTDYVSDILHTQSLAVDLAYYESPDYYDIMHRAQREAPYRPTQIVNGLVQIAQSLVSLLGVGGLLVAFDWHIAIVLAVAAIPAVVVRATFSRKLHRLEREHAKDERWSWYYHWMMTSPSYAKEMRLLDLGKLMQARFVQTRERLRDARLSLAKRRGLANLAVQVASASAVFGALALVAYRTVTGAVTVGALVMYYQAIQMVAGHARGILTSLTGLYEDSLFLSDFYHFLDLAPEISAPADPASVPDAAAHGIAFEGVSFGYPSAKTTVVSDIDLQIAPGEVIALVGENGAGKTTLIKLLCRLYDPAGGRITVDGVDLRQFDPVDWRSQVSVVFQDFAHYNLSVAENIWLGNIKADPGDGTIKHAATLSGVDAVVERLPRGYETVLGHWFEDGHELSLGEWQKIALARAFMRDRGIVVLDEPTSSLDALAEADLFRRFRQLMAGRSAILISHRFSTVHLADRIYVLDDGHIIEVGTHRELMQRQGLYARMYTAQAEHYRETTPIDETTPGVAWREATL